MAENSRTIGYGVGCLIASALLLVAGYFLRQRGWWD
jgi:hypothetical protein